MAGALASIYGRHKELRHKSKGYRILVSVLTIAIAAYVGICLVVVFTQGRLLYFPTRDIHMTPKAAGLEYDDLMLPCPSGGEISAWFVPAKNARGTILFCHGNGGNNADRVESIDIFNRMGLNCLIFDYRGYGKSTGSPSEKRTYEDALVCWNYLTKDRAKAGKETIASDRIVIFGRSLGGAVGTWLAAHTKPRALIVESSFTSVADMGARLYPWLPVRLLAVYRYNSIGTIRDVKCPVLVAHSPDDEIVPYSFGRKLFDAAPEPKEFLEMKGDHNEGWATMGDTYANGLEPFITKCLGPGPK